MKSNSIINYSKFLRTCSSIELKGLLFGLCLYFTLSSSITFAENVLQMGDARGEPGDRRVGIRIQGRHDGVELHGFSLSVTYPTEVLRWIGFSKLGTALEPIEPDFYIQKSDTEKGHGALGVILSYSHPIEYKEIPPTQADGPPHTLAWLYFDILSEAAVGDYPVTFQDELFDPPLFNRFSHKGQSINPFKIDGIFTIETQEALTMESVQSFPGLRATTFVHARHSQPLRGYQINMVFEKERLTLEQATLHGTDVAAHFGNQANIDFFSTELDPSYTLTLARAAAGVIFDYPIPRDPPRVLPPQTASLTGQSLVRYDFLISDSAREGGEYVLLKLEDETGDQPNINALVLGLTSILPQLNSGKIYFSTGDFTGRVVNELTREPISGVEVILDPVQNLARTDHQGRFQFRSIPPGPYSLRLNKTGFFPSYQKGYEVEGLDQVTEAPDLFLFPRPTGGEGFRRGYLNEDDLLDITDAIFLLSYLFLGDPQVTCEDAADVNDDSRMDITDPITLLEFLFLGKSVPQAPFIECGLDPSEDDLSCEQQFGCS